MSFVGPILLEHYYYYWFREWYEVDTIKLWL